MENKFDIEDFVKNNNQLFNQEEPDKGHFDRFKAKLEQNSKKKNNKILRISMRITSVAAVLVLGFVIFNHTNDFVKSKKISETISFETNENFNEVSDFYQSQIDSKINEINHLECKKSVNQKEQINEDLSELTNSFNELNNEYKNNPDNPMIQNAMITNYQTRVSMLDMIADKLKKYC